MATCTDAVTLFQAIAGLIIGAILTSAVMFQAGLIGSAGLLIAG